MFGCDGRGKRKKREKKAHRHEVLPRGERDVPEYESASAAAAARSIPVAATAAAAHHKDLSMAFALDHKGLFGVVAAGGKEFVCDWGT